MGRGVASSIEETLPTLLINRLRLYKRCMLVETVILLSTHALSDRDLKVCMSATMQFPIPHQQNSSWVPYRYASVRDGTGYICDSSSLRIICALFASFRKFAKFMRSCWIRVLMHREHSCFVVFVFFSLSISFARVDSFWALLEGTLKRSKTTYCIRETNPFFCIADGGSLFCLFFLSLFYFGRGSRI